MAVRGGQYALKGKTENVFRNQGPKYSRIERSLSAVSLTAIRCKLYLGQLGLSAVFLTATRCKLYLRQQRFSNCFLIKNVFLDILSRR